jgi:hypothetical protein
MTPDCDGEYFEWDTIDITSLDEEESRKQVLSPETLLAIRVDDQVIKLRADPSGSTTTLINGVAVTSAFNRAAHFRELMRIAKTKNPQDDPSQIFSVLHAQSTGIDIVCCLPYLAKLCKTSDQENVRAEGQRIQQLFSQKSKIDVTIQFGWDAGEIYGPGNRWKTVYKVPIIREIQGHIRTLSHMNE